MACLSMAPWLCTSTTGRSPTASLSFSAGYRPNRSSSVSLKMGPTRSALLHCSLITCPSSSLSLSSSTSFSGLSLGLNFNHGETTEKRRGLVVRAGKAALCQTKRSRSRKSLARTHGFRKRMSTANGRAIIRRRRAKGRWTLCTKSNHNSGKRR